MSIEKVRSYLEPYGVADRIREFEVSSATVQLAAAALGVDEARIAKSLSFHTGAGCMIIVMAGDVKVDNHLFKQQFGFKARMLSAEDALLMTGHAVGGVCRLQSLLTSRYTLTNRLKDSLRSFRLAVRRQAQ